MHVYMYDQQNNAYTVLYLHEVPLHAPIINLQGGGNFGWRRGKLFSHRLILLVSSRPARNTRGASSTPPAHLLWTSGKLTV